MKKVLAIAFTILLVISLAPCAYAAEPASRPDWLITELCADTKGFSASQSGYTDNSDGGEFIELYNNSGRALDLYDYCLTYNGDERNHANFCKQITEITPLKAGDYRDESTGKQLMSNPATCIVQPGECVVLWSVFSDAINLGLTENKFRAHWGITDDIKVIAFDGAGHSKNFNVKNSAVGTYGIAEYNATLQSKKNSYIDTPSGYDNYGALISYATFDYSQIGSSIANHTANFTYPISGKSMNYESYAPYMASTPGYLNEAQLMSIDAANAKAAAVSEADNSEPLLMPTVSNNVQQLPLSLNVEPAAEMVQEEKNDQGCASFIVLPAAILTALGFAVCIKKH